MNPCVASLLFLHMTTQASNGFVWCTCTQNRREQDSSAGEMKQLKDPPAFSWTVNLQVPDEEVEGAKGNRRLERRMRILGKQPLRKRPRTAPGNAESDLLDWAEGELALDAAHHPQQAMPELGEAKWLHINTNFRKHLHQVSIDFSRMLTICLQIYLQSEIDLVVSTGEEGRPKSIAKIGPASPSGFSFGQKVEQASTSGTQGQHYS